MLNFGRSHCGSLHLSKILSVRPVQPSMALSNLTEPMLLAKCVQKVFLFNIIFFVIFSIFDAYVLSLVECRIVSDGGLLIYLLRNSGILLADVF